jgi:hypothetical protein
MDVQFIIEGSTESLALNTFSLAGEQFCGWRTTPDGPIVYADGATITMAKADLVLYAHWDYDIGEIGPAGGKIFYVNPNSATDGWRFLELAPLSTQVSLPWGTEGIAVGTSGALGQGQNNTDMMIAALGTATNYSARYCANLVYGGHDDWFFPSLGDLSQAWTALYLTGLDSFSATIYSCSSEAGSSYAASHTPVLYFERPNYYVSWAMKRGYMPVRAVRSF